MFTLKNQNPECVVNDLPATTAKRLLIIIAVMSATLMQVLDATIINVALPHMQGSLSVSSDQITWTVTSYLVASAIFMPLTGYFSDIFGNKRYLLISIAGFTITSVLCGASQSLFEVVLFRLLQGAFGAALVPLSQTILASIYSRAELGKAMAIWGTGVMAGPILGPTLGGYITEVSSWRWIFYVNVPVGILALFLAWEVVPDSPKKQRRMDWWGMILLSLAIGAFQYLLDRGNQRDWLNSADVKMAALITLVSFSSFIIYSFRFQQPEAALFNITIFKDRNFTIASLLLGMLGLGMFGAMVIQPMMLENLLHYSVLTTGLVMAPRGISSMISMVIAGKLIKRIDARWLIICGIVLCAVGTELCTRYSFNISPGWIIWPLFIQGLGLGLILLPISTIAFSTLPEEAKAEAAGLFSLLRTLGASIGISIVVMVFTRHAQMAWNQLGGFINPYRPAVNHYLQSLHLSTAHPLAPTVLGQELLRQAQMVAFVTTYDFVTWSFWFMVPLVFLLAKQPKIPPGAEVQMVE